MASIFEYPLSFEEDFWQTLTCKKEARLVKLTGILESVVKIVFKIWPSGESRAFTLIFTMLSKFGHKYQYDA